MTCVTATVVKESPDSTLGIGLSEIGGGCAPVITRLDSTGLLAKTNLRVGMHLVRVNGHDCTRNGQATALLRSSEGTLTIEAEQPKVLTALGSEANTKSGYSGSWANSSSLQ